MRRRLFAAALALVAVPAVSSAGNHLRLRRHERHLFERRRLHREVSGNRADLSDLQRDVDRS